MIGMVANAEGKRITIVVHDAGVRDWLYAAQSIVINETSYANDATIEFYYRPYADRLVFAGNRHGAFMRVRREASVSAERIARAGWTWAQIQQ